MEDPLLSPWWFIRHESSRQDSLEEHRQLWWSHLFPFLDTTQEVCYTPELATRLPVPTARKCSPGSHFWLRCGWRPGGRLMTALCNAGQRHAGPRCRNTVVHRPRNRVSTRCYYNKWRIFFLFFILIFFDFFLVKHFLTHKRSIAFLFLSQLVNHSVDNERILKFILGSRLPLIFPLRQIVDISVLPYSFLSADFEVRPLQTDNKQP